jgi:hypothetical protein
VTEGVRKISQIVRLVNVSVSRERRRWRKVEPLLKFPKIKSGFSMGCVLYAGKRISSRKKKNQCITAPRGQTR